MEDYMRAVEAWMLAMNKALEWELSGVRLPPVPLLKDYPDE